VTTFVEIGPGTVLSALVKKAVPGSLTLNVESPESLAETLAALPAGQGA
jgi:hypothetical protein